MNYKNLSGNPYEARRFILRIFMCFFIIIWVLFVAGILNMSYLKAVLAAMAIPLCILVILFIACSPKKFKKHIQKIKSKQYVVMWKYSAEEWKNFANDKFKDHKSGLRFAIAFICLFAVIFFAIIGFVTKNMIFFIGMSVAVIAIFFLIYILESARINSEKNREFNITNSDVLTTYVDTDFVISGGKYFDLVNKYIILRGAHIEDQKFMITFHKITRNTATGVRQKYLDEIVIPIPKNKMKEASDALVKFNKKLKEKGD